MSVGVLGDPLLCYPTTLHLGQMLPVWCDERQRVGRTFTVLPPTLHLGQLLPVLVP